MNLVCKIAERPSPIRIYIFMGCGSLSGMEVQIIALGGKLNDMGLDG